MSNLDEVVTQELNTGVLTVNLSGSSPEDAAEILKGIPAELAVDLLQSMNPAIAHDILDELDPERRSGIFAAASPEQRAQWKRNLRYPEDTVGRLMEPPHAVFSPDETIGEAIEDVRELAKSTLVTYGYVIDEMGRLLGLITMRDLLLSDRQLRLADVMLKDPFTLTPDLELREAMKLVVSRHFPVYPVCDGNGALVGLVRGRAMFEEQAFEISAQPGRMVGVDKEERLSTAWPRSLKMRHPWLQLNLLTAFIAAAVVGLFQDTIDRVVILAAFLPVLAGQSGNTGCQALAVALRGLTLGELERGRDDPGADHPRGRPGGRDGVRERGQQRRHRPWVRSEPDADTCGDPAHPLRSHEHAPQVVAGRLGGLRPERDDVARWKHD
ncbi:MAG: CBS domain-containing protein, partial [Acidobacteria bacterium]|nr:CBS domain-containing protein [Acidobacteriota bacterium]